MTVFHSLQLHAPISQTTGHWLVQETSCTISVKAAFQRTGVTALQVTSRHRIIYGGFTAGNKWAVVSTRHRNFNCKLTERQVYKTGISSGNPSSEKSVHELNSRYLFPTFLRLKCQLGRLWKLHMPWKITQCVFKKVLVYL